MQNTARRLPSFFVLFFLKLFSDLPNCMHIIRCKLPTGKRFAIQACLCLKGFSLNIIRTRFRGIGTFLQRIIWIFLFRMTGNMELLRLCLCKVVSKGQGCNSFSIFYYFYYYERSMEPPPLRDKAFQKAY